MACGPDGEDDRVARSRRPGARPRVTHARRSPVLGPGPRRCFARLPRGEVSEWLKVPLSKSGVRKHRGLESHPLRQPSCRSPSGGARERSPRGLGRGTGNAVWGNSSWVRIPPSPPLPSPFERRPLSCPCRARRGTSGALYLQSAPAGLKSPPEVRCPRTPTGRSVLRIGSRAAATREPRQVRKEAALSAARRVPRTGLVRAGRHGRARERS